MNSKGSHHPHNNHHHHRQKPKWNKKSSAKNIIPKNVLKFPQHLPVHILDLDVHEMDSDDVDVDETSQQTNRPISVSPAEATTSTTTMALSETTTITSSTTTTTTTTAAVAANTNIISDTKMAGSSTIDANAAGVAFASGLTPNIPPNTLVDGIVLDDRATSIPVYNNGGELSIQSTELNNTMRPVILVDDKESIIGTSTVGRGDGNDDGEVGIDGNTEKGYYEKTIVNKNGVFIENIRKITNIDQRILGSVETKEVERSDVDSKTASATASAASSSSVTASESSSDAINRKSIELMNAPIAHAQHYVITSSGKIEKTANDDQFTGGLTNSNSKIFNTMNRDYNRGQEEEEQQQEQNSNGDLLVIGNEYGGDSSVTTTIEATGLVSGLSTDSMSSAVSSTAPLATMSSVSSTNCIVMGK